MIAAPAQALSCMRYGVNEALHEVLKAKEGYVAATGTLTFDKRELPEVDMAHQNRTKPITRIKARLKGKALTRSGFTHPLNTAVNFEVHCYGPWCASAVSGKKVLAFLEQTKSGYTLSTNPCGGHVFYEPTAATLKNVEHCYAKGNCPKTERP